MLEIEVKRQVGDFRIEAGLRAPAAGITALFGPSGAGKTTLVMMVAGLLRPDEGRIALNGRVLFDSAAGIDVSPARRGLGYVFQEGRLFPHLSVRANLQYGMRAAKGGPRLDFLSVVEMLAIAPLLDRRPYTLSGGERQRVAIGRALLAGPKLLLMDEPLASLDAERKDEILPFIEHLRTRFALPVLYVTHAIAEIVRLADAMVVLQGGHVVASGAVAELLSRLDLMDLTGREDAGAVLAVEILGQDRDYGLTRLGFSGGELLVPCIDAPPGARLRIRIHARDVALALEPPGRISVLNVVPGRIAELGEGSATSVEVRLDIGVPLLARITRKSLRELDLRPGKKVFALIKSVAVDRGTIRVD